MTLNKLLSASLCLMLHSTITIPVNGVGGIAPNSPSHLDSYDHYGRICWEDEKRFLRRFADLLKAEPDAKGYIVAYGARLSTHKKEAIQRAQRAKNHLTANLGIPSGRVSIVDGGYREDLQIYLLTAPEGGSAPVPAPTIPASEVRIIKKRNSSNCSPDSSSTTRKRKS